MEPTTGGTLPADRRLTIEPSMTPEDLEEELLPGIHNDLTLSVIIPKLSWRELASLCSVSPGWEKAIRGGLVQDARVWTRSTETLVAISHDIGDSLITCSVYSMRDKSWYELPPIPGFQRGMPCTCKCIAVGCKIFVLGGRWRLGWRRGRRRLVRLLRRKTSRTSNTVYVLDLAVEREWKKCASMREPRESFGVNVINGKIYVFGGFSNGNTICGAEVYDPVIDAWSRIRPMLSFRGSHNVMKIGEEFFVYGGYVFNAEQVWDRDWRSGIERLEVYHSVKDEWRLIAPVGTLGLGAIMFTAQGKFYAMTRDGIYVSDTDKLSWTFRKSCPLPEIEVVGSTVVDLPLHVLPVDDELLVHWYWYNGGNWRRRCILQSKGFGHETKQIEWEIVKLDSQVSLSAASPPEQELGNPMCSIKI